MAQNPVADSLSRLIEIAPADSNKVKLLIKLSKKIRSTEPEKAAEYCKTALKLSKDINYDLGEAEAFSVLGVIHYFSGNYTEALIQWQEAERMFKKANDTKGLSNVLSNMGAIYHNQSEYGKAIEIYLKALALAEKDKDNFRIGTVLQNIGAVHIEKGDNAQALKFYKRALQIFKELNYEEGIGLAELNIGDIYISEDSDQAIDYLKSAILHLKKTSYYTSALRTLGSTIVDTDFDQGMRYLDSAYVVAAASGDQLEMIRTINTLGNVYEIAGYDEKAMEYYSRAKTLLLEAERADAEMKISTAGLVRLYLKKNDFKNAFENQRLLQTINDSIYNIESDKKIDQMLFTFELEKKENTINLLEKDQKIKNIELDRQKSIRNGFMAGFILVLLFALVFFAQRNRISKEKKRSEELLHNILPEEVATELKIKERSDAQLFDQVTVLFTDFKGFTSIAENTSPQNLVNELNMCFSAFDEITTKYGIEKIKTIGDAYMAVGGLPTPTADHPRKVVLAALEMAAFIESEKIQKITQNIPYFEVRIGIHTGPVVAGIVGVKKFQYDIWGDTVNTASRMESAGTAGRVNISEASYNLLKDDADFTFEGRGKIEAKGKGEMEMYFVAKA